MEILSAIIQLFGGLAMFLYGIELMGDGLKNSSGAVLKRVFLTDFAGAGAVSSIGFKPNAISLLRTSSGLLSKISALSSTLQP